MNRERSFSAAVFDMDGVIFDTEPVWLEAETILLSRRGHLFPPNFAHQIMGVPGGQAMKMVVDHFKLDDDPVQMTRELNGIFHDLLETKLVLMPGVTQRLDHLEKRGLPKGVATSTERVLAQHMLGRFGLIERFDFILTRDDVTQGKPHPEIYERACSAHGISPDKVIVWEDSLAGTQSARGAGCYVVALRHPLTQSLTFSHADIVVDHHSDERVDALFGGVDQ